MIQNKSSDACTVQILAVLWIKIKTSPCSSVNKNGYKHEPLLCVMRRKDLKESLLKSYSLGSRVCVTGTCGYLACIFLGRHSEKWYMNAEMKFPLWTDKSYDNSALLAGYIGQMRTEQCSSNSLCRFAGSAAVTGEEAEGWCESLCCTFPAQYDVADGCLSLQPAHAVHPAARPVRGHQHPAAGAAARHGHAHHAALAPRHRHAETTAAHHGTGNCTAPSCCCLTALVSIDSRLRFNSGEELVRN